eukprot:223915_1
MTSRITRKRKLESDVEIHDQRKRRKLNDDCSSELPIKQMTEQKDTDNETRFVFILAHGAGTNSKHPNMTNWKKRLSDLGVVIMFDFKRPFNKMDKLIATYQAVIDSTIEQYPMHKLILIGTSMGSRVSIHLANTNSLPGNCTNVIALGYPLYVKKGNKMRDQVLLDFIYSTDECLKQTRLCLISGSKDCMAPQKIMNAFYDKIKNEKVGATRKCELHWIDGGNHSLKVGKRHLLSQNDVHQTVVDIISEFITK